MDGRASEEAGNAPRILAMAWAMGFVMWGLLLAVSALLPLIQEELALSFSLRALVFALPLLVLALAALPGGYLTDRYGIRRTAGVGSLVAVAGAGLRAVPGSAPLLLGAAAVFGLGLGLVIPNLPKLVSRWFRDGREGLATGLYSTGLIGGSAMGAAVTLPLAEVLASWRGALALWAALGAVVVGLWWALLPPDAAPRARPRRTGYGEVLRSPSLWVLAFLFAAANASYFFLVDAYPEFLFRAGLSREAASAQLSLLIAVGIPAIFLAPVLSDRLGRRRPFVWGPHLLLALLLFLLPRLPLGAVWAVSVLLGLAEMAIFALALLLPVDLFPPERVGRASGVVVSVAYVGAVLGPLGNGLLVDLTGSLGIALAAFATLSLVAAGVTLLLPEAGTGGL